MQPSSQSIEFTAAERRELALRERETQRVLARLAATATLKEQEELADELCPKHDAWIQGRNRVQASRRVAPAAARPTRPGRVAVKRRARAGRTTTPTRGDPDDGDPDPAPPRRLDGRRDIEAWVAERREALTRLFRGEGP
jgi:hypothetical protein